MARKKGKGKAVKGARQKFGAHYESEDLKLASHTMVIHRGNIEKTVKELIDNMRRVMEPYTATALKVTKKNSLKDFVAIAGPLHVTHLLVFTQTEIGDYMKIVRVPRGPTIHFKLEEYSLCNDVLSVLKKKHTHKKQFLFQPLLILNGFTTKAGEEGAAGGMEPQYKLLATALQNMFPSINVTKVNLNDIRRCVLFNLNKEDKTIEFRHYNIKLMPVGLSRPVKKLVQEKLPDLSNCQDISELLQNNGYFSESEAELDGPDNEVKITKDVKSIGSLNLKDSTSAIRLTEIGPRLKLKLFKIEEGVCDGAVLFHDLVQKTPEELKAMRESLAEKKKKEKEKKAQKLSANGSTNGKGKKRPREEDDDDDGEDDYKYEQEDNVDDEDDREYFKKELDQEPDKDLFEKNKKRKSFDPSNRRTKKGESGKKIGRYEKKAPQAAKFFKVSQKKKLAMNSRK